MANDATKLVRAIMRAVDADPRFEVRMTKGGHYSVYTAEGQWVSNFPHSPGNDAKRSVLNSLAPLKRAGFEWPQKGGRGK